MSKERYALSVRWGVFVFLSVSVAIVAWIVAADLYGVSIFVLLGMASLAVLARMLSKSSFDPLKNPSVQALLGERLTPEIRQSWHRASSSLGLTLLSEEPDPRTISFGGKLNERTIHIKITSRKTTCAILPIKDSVVDPDWATICCPKLWERMLTFGDKSLLATQKKEGGVLVPREPDDGMWAIGAPNEYQRKLFRWAFPRDLVSAGEPLAKAGLFADEEKLCIELLETLTQPQEIEAFARASVGLLVAMESKEEEVREYVLAQLQRATSDHDNEAAMRFAGMAVKHFSSYGKVWKFFFQAFSTVRTKKREATARERELLVQLLRLCHEHYGDRRKARQLLQDLGQHPDPSLRSMALLLQGWGRGGAALQKLFRKSSLFHKHPVAFTKSHWEVLEALIEQEQGAQELGGIACMLADWCDDVPQKIDSIYPTYRVVDLMCILAEKLAIETKGFRRIEEAWIQLLYFQASDPALLAAQAMGIKHLSAATPQTIHMAVLDAFFAFGTTRSLKPLQQYIKQWTLSAAMQDKVKATIDAIHKRFPASQGGMLSVVEGDGDSAQGALSYVEETDGKVSLANNDEGDTDEGGAS